MLARLLVILSVMLCCNAFLRSYVPNSVVLVSSRFRAAQSSSAGNGEKWPGNRPPMPNLDQLEQRIDATWGRGKFREEIWADKGNPVNEWWIAYNPSQEQLQAAAAGFDFSDVEEWCKVKGIDYEKAMEDYKEELKKRFELHSKAKEEKRKKFNMADFRKLREEYRDMERLAFEHVFRLIDDERQKAKGQPSLDAEDTGVQYLNDKESA